MKDDPTTSTGSSAGQTPWRRVHPVTPLVRGWTVIAALLVIVGQLSMEDLPDASDAVSRWWLPLLGALVAVALVVVGYSVLAWRMVTYAVDDESVRLHRGIVFRQQRKARLDRLQAVDIVQPLVARLVGLAELKIEVAGGAGSAVRLGFLKVDEAERLRREILARAAGVDTTAVAQGGDGSGMSPEGATEAPQAPERPVTAVPVSRLLGSMVASGASAVAVCCVAFLVALVVWKGTPAVLITALPIIFGVSGYFFNRFTREYGFRSAISPDGIRLRHGLLETRSQTIPPGRVQALRLSQGPLWRRTDWWRVDVNVAGYGAWGEQGAESTNLLLPVGTRDEALTAMWLVLPDLGAQNPVALLDEALCGRGGGEFFTVSPRRSRWLSPLTWRRTGVAVTERALVLRSGWLVRRVVVVPHERAQSLGLRQGPVQRALALVTFTAHSTQGPIVPTAANLDAEDGVALLAQQSDRAGQARADAGPELWMRRDEVPR